MIFSILENLDYVNFGEIEENTLSIDVTDLEEQKQKKDLEETMEII